MNLRKIIVTVVALVASVVCSFAQSKVDKITVSGNCGMCQKHIQDAAKKAGAQRAQWDRKTKVLTVVYNQASTSNDAIQKSVAAAGYDTEKYAGDEKAYKSLDECCQYDNKKKAQ
jgi:hypothetical protein